MQCAVCSVQCAVCCLQYAVCSVLCAVRPPVTRGIFHIQVPYTGATLVERTSCMESFNFVCYKKGDILSKNQLINLYCFELFAHERFIWKIGTSFDHVKVCPTPFFSH